MTYQVTLAACWLTATTLALAALGCSASAQQPATGQSDTKSTPKQPAATPQSRFGDGSAPVAAQPQFIFSPWTKICSEDRSKNACGVLSEARVETGQVAAAAAVVEPKESSRKLLRLTLPLGVRLEPGTRITIDQASPVQGFYIACLPSGCISDYDATPELIENLKKGHELTVQAINPGGYPISISMPLASFAKAYEGPPKDEKAIAESQKKLQEELERLAEDARKRLEAQQPQTAHSSQPAATPAPTVEGR